MQFSLILATLQVWAPIAVIVFVVALIILALKWPPVSQRRDQVERLDRWLRARQARSPRMSVWPLAIGALILAALLLAALR